MEKELSGRGWQRAQVMAQLLTKENLTGMWLKMDELRDTADIHDRMDPPEGGNAKRAEALQVQEDMYGRIEIVRQLAEYILDEADR